MERVRRRSAELNAAPCDYSHVMHSDVIAEVPGRGPSVSEGRSETILAASQYEDSSIPSGQTRDAGPSAASTLIQNTNSNFSFEHE